jgi:hypothetical protein
MASGQFLGVSLTDWASIATIAGTIVVIVGAVAAIIRSIKPIRQSLGRRRFFGWLLTRKDRAQIALNAQNEADKEKAREAAMRAEKAAMRANLEFELRSDGMLAGVAELVTRNKGPCEARNVWIYGELSQSLWLDYEKQNELRDGAYGLVIRYKTISPGTSLVEEGLSIKQWQIVGGLARWNLLTDWDDDAGNHYNQSDEARKQA